MVSAAMGHMSTGPIASLGGSSQRVYSGVVVQHVRVGYQAWSRARTSARSASSRCSTTTSGSGRSSSSTAHDVGHARLPEGLDLNGPPFALHQILLVPLVHLLDLLEVVLFRLLRSERHPCQGPTRRVRLDLPAPKVQVTDAETSPQLPVLAHQQRTDVRAEEAARLSVRRSDRDDVLRRDRRASTPPNVRDSVRIS